MEAKKSHEGGLILTRPSPRRSLREEANIWPHGRTVPPSAPVEYIWSSDIQWRGCLRGQTAARAPPYRNVLPFVTHQMAARKMDTGINFNGEPVGEVGLLSPLCIEPSTPIREALLVLRAQHRGALLVCRDSVLVGILTERDVVRILAEGRDLNAPIADEMVEHPLTLRDGDSIALAIRRMAENGYRRLPVVDEADRPVGLVDVEGIVHFLVQHFPEAVYNLPPVANPATREREGP